MTAGMEKSGRTVRYLGREYQELLIEEKAKEDSLSLTLLPADSRNAVLFPVLALTLLRCWTNAQVSLLVLWGIVCSLEGCSVWKLLPPCGYQQYRFYTILSAA